MARDTRGNKFRDGIVTTSNMFSGWQQQETTLILWGSVVSHGDQLGDEDVIIWFLDTWGNETFFFLYEIDSGFKFSLPA